MFSPLNPRSFTSRRPSRSFKIPRLSAINLAFITPETQRKKKITQVPHFPAAFQPRSDFGTGIQMGAISKHAQQPEWRGIKLMTPNVRKVFTCSYGEFFFRLRALESSESLCRILKVPRKKEQIIQSILLKGGLLFYISQNNQCFISSKVFIWF